MKVVGKLAYLVALFSVTSSSSTSGVAAHDDEDVGIDNGLNRYFLRGVMNFIVNNNNENNAESSCTASDEWCDNDEIVVVIFVNRLVGALVNALAMQVLPAWMSVPSVLD